MTLPAYDTPLGVHASACCACARKGLRCTQQSLLWFLATQAIMATFGGLRHSLCPFLGTSVQSEKAKQLLALTDEQGRAAVARTRQIDLDQPRLSPLFPR
jgi:hypothetical protein